MTTNKELYKLIGSRIKEARQFRGMTQRALAEKVTSEVVYVDLYERDISFYESGELAPPLAKVLKIANALDVSMDYLFGRTMIDWIREKEASK